MKLSQIQVNNSREFGHFLLEQGSSSSEAFHKVEKVLSELDYVTISSGDDEESDYGYDKFFTSFSEIKEAYKLAKKEAA